MSAEDNEVDERRRERETLRPRLEVDAAERATDGVPRECLQAEQPARICGLNTERDDIRQLGHVSPILFSSK